MKSFILLFTALYVTILQAAQPNTQPPNHLAPATNPGRPWSTTDSFTQSYPMGNLDTMPLQSTGTYWSHHPESHPIPLTPIPVPTKPPPR